jgi:hypothetical protein
MRSPPVIAAVEEGASARGWIFRCDMGGAGETRVRLDWADYDHWCPGGDVGPSLIAEAVIRTMLEHGVTVPAEFDAARVRHRVPHADERVAALIRR